MPDLDLDALRDAIQWERKTRHWRLGGEWTDHVGKDAPFGSEVEAAADARVNAHRAVDSLLALVEEQRKEIERLREALNEYGQHWPICGATDGGRCVCGWDKTRAALAGYPAANKEPT